MNRCHCYLCLKGVRIIRWEYQYINILSVFSVILTTYDVLFNFLASFIMSVNKGIQGYSIQNGFWDLIS